MNPLSKSTPLAIRQREPEQRAQDLFLDWLKGKSPETGRSYKFSAQAFQVFVGAKDNMDAIQGLISMSHGEANHLMLQWKNSMVESGASPNTVNARLAAIRSLVGAYNSMGLCPWTLAIKGERATVYRDTAGPGFDGVQDMLTVVAKYKNKELQARDNALLWLLYGQAFRRNGAHMLDVQDLDLKAKTIKVLLKGSRRDKTEFALSDKTIEALKHWLKVRGYHDGPLFPGRDKGQRLSNWSIWSIVKRIGEKAGIKKMATHKLRHSGLTAALDATDGNLREVLKFSGHRDIKTLMVYDDRRKHVGSQVANKVGERHK